MMTGRKVIVVEPHGFCSGVAHALAKADAALRDERGPVFCLHEIVHNAQVVSGLTARGMRFVERVEDVPRGAALLLSAHGVAPAVYAAAAARNLRVIDATCPFVAKVHQEVRRFVADGCTVICIGHRQHKEVLGVAGEAPERVRVVETAEEARQADVPDPRHVAMVTQTTLSQEMVASIRDVLRERFPDLRQPSREDVCYATRNRQLAVRLLAAQVQAVLVLGSAASSNSRRLAETARAAGCPAFLIGQPEDLRQVDLDGFTALGVTSGASTPESFLEAMLDALRARGFTEQACLGAVEERLGGGHDHTS